MLTVQSYIINFVYKWTATSDLLCFTDRYVTKKKEDIVTTWMIQTIIPLYPVVFSVWANNKYDEKIVFFRDCSIEIRTVH